MDRRSRRARRGRAPRGALLTRRRCNRTGWRLGEVAEVGGLLEATACSARGRVLRAGYGIPLGRAAKSAGDWPETSRTLSPAGAGIGGDNATVSATGCRAESGAAAVDGAVARYVFDVGNWDNCTWIVVGGASGDPASPHYTDQHEAWSRCELIPMRYDWDAISAAGPQLTLQPDGGISTGAGPA